MSTQNDDRENYSKHRRKERVGKAMRGLLVGNSEAGAEPKSQQSYF